MALHVLDRVTPLQIDARARWEQYKKKVHAPSWYKTTTAELLHPAQRQILNTITTATQETYEIYTDAAQIDNNNNNLIGIMIWHNTDSIHTKRYKSNNDCDINDLELLGAGHQKT